MRRILKRGFGCLLTFVTVASILGLVGNYGVSIVVAWLLLIYMCGLIVFWCYSIFWK
jgi:hypothetical protein